MVANITKKLQNNNTDVHIKIQFHSRQLVEEMQNEDVLSQSLLGIPRICAMVPARGEGSAFITMSRNQGLLI